MSELGRPSGQNIAAPLFDKCIEQLGAEVAARRAHTRTNEGDGLPRAFFALGGSWDDDGRWRRAREIIMRTAADSAIFAVIH